jgi:hypothetical protein
MPKKASATSRKSPSAKTKASKRSPNVTPEIIDCAIFMINGWNGRLTWPALIKAIQEAKGIEYARQTLHNNGSIRSAYLAYQERRRPHAPKASSSLRSDEGSESERAQVARLNQRIAQLTKERDLLLERFARWAYNASSRGLTADLLDAPLPQIDRQREPN